MTNNEVSLDEAKALVDQGFRVGDPAWDAQGIFEHITRPRIEAAITGRTPNGEPVKGDYKFIDEFPMAEGFEENVEFFELTYQDAAAVELDLAFEAVAPMLWLRAGGQGSVIEQHDDSGFAWADRYGVLWDTDRWRPFVASAPESLSQAGRALVAAYIVEGWRSEGHGIASDGLEGDIRAVTCRDQRPSRRRQPGLFLKVATCLGSPTLRSPVTLDRLCSALPAQAWPSEHLANARPSALALRPQQLGRHLTTSVQGTVYGLPLWLLDTDDVAKTVREYLAVYPTLGDWEFVALPTPHGIAVDESDALPCWSTRLMWTVDAPTGGDSERRTVILSRASARPPGPAQPVGWVLPEFHSGEGPLAPLLLWWAILHALSMLARYSPAAWIRHIDVNASPTGVELEALLDAALSEVPALVLQASRYPYEWSQPGV